MGSFSTEKDFEHGEWIDGEFFASRNFDQHQERGMGAENQQCPSKQTAEGVPVGVGEEAEGGRQGGEKREGQREGQKGLGAPGGACLCLEHSAGPEHQGGPEQRTRGEWASGQEWLEQRGLLVDDRSGRGEGEDGGASGKA